MRHPYNRHRFHQQVRDAKSQSVGACLKSRLIGTLKQVVYALSDEDSEFRKILTGMLLDKICKRRFLVRCKVRLGRGIGERIDWGRGSTMVIDDSVLLVGDLGTVMRDRKTIRGLRRGTPKGQSRKNRRALFLERTPLGRGRRR